MKKSHWTLLNLIAFIASALNILSLENSTQKDWGKEYHAVSLFISY